MNQFSLNPKVSVITVCFNSEKHLERTIQSVLSQSYKHIEYIVVDGKSTDGTLKILDKYRNRVNCLISEPDNGIYDAMNKGIRLATGDFLSFLNSDDRFYERNTVEKVMEFFKNKNKNIDFVYGNMLCCNLDNSEFYLKKYPSIITKRYFLRNPLGHSATFFHKNCFIKAGYFDTRYKISADYEWYLRALFEYDLCGAHIKEILSVFQEGGTSSHQSLLLSERKSVQKLYIAPFEMVIGNCINFLLYGDIFRIVVYLVFRKKGYWFFRSWYRGLRGRKYCADVMKKMQE